MKLPDVATMQDFMVSLPAVLYQYVLYADHSSEFLYVSPQSYDILGYTNEYFIEDMNNFWSLVHPDDLERLKSEDISANRQNEFFISTVRINHPARGEVWIQISSRPTDGKKNNAVIWMGYIIDITDRMNMAANLELLNKKLEALSFSDGLTGVLNRRAFDEALHKEWKHARRHKSELSLVMIDIDYFKLYNDNYGHSAGDKCLKLVSKALSEVIKRETDLVARYGGEEFAILLPETNAKDANSLAEECRNNVSRLQLPHEKSKVDSIVSVSLGVSTIVPDTDSQVISLIEAADKALYQAKQNGRNRVVTK